MKKRIIYLLAGFMFLALLPVQLKALTSALPPESGTSVNAQTVDFNALTIRVNEIKALDKSTLTPSEKRSLRKETRSLKQQLRQLSGGVYISAGALLVCLLLIILLL